MNVMNPADDEFSKMLSGFNKRLKALEVPRTPYIGEWRVINELVNVIATGSIYKSTIAFPPLQTEIVGGGTIDLSDVVFNSTTVIQVGYAIRIKQQGTFLYFYAGRYLGNNEWSLYQDGTNSLDVNYPIEEIAVSPRGGIGFPEVMELSMTNFTVSGGGSPSIVVTTSEGAYSMRGGLIDVVGNISLSTISGTTGVNTFVQFEMPQFQKGDSYELTTRKIIDIGVAGTVQVGKTQLFTSGANLEIGLSKQDSSSLTNGSFFAYFEQSWRNNYV